MRVLFMIGSVLLPALAQTPCESPRTYTPCDIVYEMTAAEAAAHPNPHLSLKFYAEVKSPRFKTYLVPAFWDGGRKLVLRFTPNEAGPWEWRLTSDFARFQNQTGKVEAAESEALGFIEPANVHHWRYTERLKPHLWMGETLPRFAYLDRKLFESIIDARANQKFNHVRAMLSFWNEPGAHAFKSADEPNPEFLREFESRLAYANQKGLIVDLVLGAGANDLTTKFPTWQQRERFIRYITSRLGGFNITWQIGQNFEDYTDGRALMKELGLLVKKHDPYNHPRTAQSARTSAPLNGDGWQTYLSYQSGEDGLGAIEHQLYGQPQVNAGFAIEEAAGTNFDTFRKRLWNATMNGQYPVYANTGTAGKTVTGQNLESPGAKAMAAWYDFFANTRYWELEPFFNVDGGRALALERVFGEGEDEEGEGIEYIVYVENPRLIEVGVRRHSYQVYWFNPSTGEKIKGKDWKGERFVSEPPTKSQDWVLHLSRDGKKEGMLRSYKFDSRPNLLQEVEGNTPRVPFSITSPTGDTISLAQPPNFEAKLTRQSRATRTMLYYWTGEVAADGQGYRVLGSGPSGKLTLPPDLATRYPAVLNLRLTGMNANGKVYTQDKVFRLVP
jgi:hypothetical protein